jgi:hypothetical protein
MSSQFRTELAKARQVRPSNKEQIISSHNCVWGRGMVHGDPLFVYTCSKECVLRDLVIQAETEDENWTLHVTLFEDGMSQQSDSAKMKKKQSYTRIHLQPGQTVKISTSYKGQTDPSPFLYTIDYFADIKDGRRNSDNSEAGI